MTRTSPTGSSRLAIAARVANHSLIAAECMSLAGGRPDADGVAPCERIDRIDRAAFVHQGVEVLARAETFDALVATVGAEWDSDIDADRFRIDVHDPSDRGDSTRMEIAKALADVIPFGPDLRHPQHRFLVIIGEADYAFGAVRAEADQSYLRHDDKPWTTSSSLDSRLARALVNLVPDAQSILDPCCGAGSIVLEAASLGLDAFGVDWKPAMVGMTRENIAHFGYDASAELADSRTHVQRADAIVTDLPYGHAISSNEHELRAILEHSATQAPLGVFVAPGDISNWLTSAGYADVEVCTVPKRRGFSRWVHVARSRSVTTDRDQPQTEPTV
jgi:tRNA G10  N-methylase Trm11